jgi:hypothetical protein
MLLYIALYILHILYITLHILHIYILRIIFYYYCYCTYLIRSFDLTHYYCIIIIIVLFHHQHYYYYYYYYYYCIYAVLCLYVASWLLTRHVNNKELLLLLYIKIPSSSYLKR